jgi:putative addiction module killer protein
VSGDAIPKQAKLYPLGYRRMMNTILRTDVFDRWLSKLKDPSAKARIIKRIRSAERGNLGDCKPVGASVSEMRIHFGPGYRLYFTRISEFVYLLLCGGIKRRQSSDITRAKELARLLREI